MTPAARVAAAIDVLDTMTAGLAAEQALTRWGRQNRYAGSKDRAAVRDHVFDVLRVKSQAAYLGGGLSGRALMLGLLRHQNLDPAEMFTGVAYAPHPLSPEEETGPAMPPGQAQTWDIPDWLIPEFTRSLGDKAEHIARALQDRAPVTLRVNARKSDRAAVAEALGRDGVQTRPNKLAAQALTLCGGARKLRSTEAFVQGWVEFQDAASQAVVEMLPAGRKCLDYCAGGGGKALALAAQDGRAVFAHDANPDRMKDIEARASRAGVEIAQLAPQELESEAPFDLVFCDAPCSGSGAWRRAPEGKWSLTPDSIEALCTLQQDILVQAARLTASNGWLIYATCSVLRVENEDAIDTFLARHPGWRCTQQRRFDVCEDGDGFFTAHLTHV